MSTKNCVPFKITVSGREIEAFIEESDWEYVCNSLSPKTGYERVDQGKEYWCVCADGYPDDQVEEMCNIDIKAYDAANYYSSQEVAENNARADKLMRQLRRFAVEHRKNELDWNTYTQGKWAIFYSYENDRLQSCDSYMSKEAFSIYFDTEETAELAIETFHDELIWYFTEYKDSL